VSLTIHDVATVRDLEPLVVREPEARRLLGNVSRAELWKMRREGAIAAFNRGRACFYDVASIRAFVARQLAAVSGPSAA
jgi:hypothetical protein